MIRKRKGISLLGLAAVALVAVGCQSRNIVGTWEAQKNVPTDDPRVGEFRFGAVTFAQDGTYTAHMIYADRQLGETGKWTTSGDTLRLTRSNRQYRYELLDGELRLTDPNTNVMLTLHRYR